MPPWAKIQDLDVSSTENVLKMCVNTTFPGADFLSLSLGVSSSSNPKMVHFDRDFVSKISFKMQQV